jgi:hypothetical protein
MSQTSLLAYESIEPLLGDLQVMVLGYIRTHPCVSDEQIIDGLCKSANTVRPRRVELHRAGWILHDGYTLTKSGRKAKTWSVNESRVVH